MIAQGRSQADSKMIKLAAITALGRLDPVFAGLFLGLMFSSQIGFANPIVLSVENNQLEKGIFLVATDNLQYSSFRETVILLTHYSVNGATGLTVNRSSHIQLNDAFPKIKKSDGSGNELFLGGPVHPKLFFVLIQTAQPQEGMYLIAKDVYFASGISAIRHGLSTAADGENARAFVGYSGWGPGQLRSEIDRGDWLVIKVDPGIIFSDNHASLWEKLRRSWSGKWI